MAQGGCLAGRVMVVTGAGRGIGREIALLAASEGGRVVVNDLGGSADGEGSDTSVAQAVVDEIARAGGAAVASGDSVADPQGAERIIGTAIDAFGRIDCVVNNAGILRDRIFHRMSAVDFDAVIKVLLANADKARALVRQVVPLLAGRHESCRFRCHTALDNALITAPDVRDPALKAKLGAIAGRVL